jgi:hypothetical protein
MLHVITTIKIYVVVHGLLSCASIFTLKMEVSWSSRLWYPTTSLHGVITQKTLAEFFIAVKISSLATSNNLYSSPNVINVI